MKEQRLKHKSGSGFTLIELIIAIGVFTVGIMGAFTLALANVKIARENQARVLGADLAREGLELVRNIRDTNWLKLQANDDCDQVSNGLQLCTPSTYLTAGVKAIDITDVYPSPLLDIPGCNPDDLVGCNCPLESCDLYINANNYYVHESGTATIYSRKIGIHKICQDAGGNEITTGGISECSALGADHTEIGLEVSSWVGWSLHGQDQDVIFKELLYYWRR